MLFFIKDKLQTTGYETYPDFEECGTKGQFLGDDFKEENFTFFFASPCNVLVVKLNALYERNINVILI